MFYQTKQGIKITDTCALSRRLSRQVHGLSNRCTFALANCLAGRLISRYRVLRTLSKLTFLTQGGVSVGDSSPSS